MINLLKRLFGLSAKPDLKLLIDMDIICTDTHGKGGFFHQSDTEKLINNLYKPIISFHLNNKK